MGAPQAASKLVFMDADTRNSIIESMAPRAAAHTLTSMEDALQAAQEAGLSEPGSPEVCVCGGGAEPQHITKPNYKTFVMGGRGSAVAVQWDIVYCQHMCHDVTQLSFFKGVVRAAALLHSQHVAALSDCRVTSQYAPGATYALLVLL
jgi:hypothetical protein